MNDEALIRRFMKEIADREFSDWVARKSYSYLKAVLDTASHLGLVEGNAARLIPAKQRIPKGVKKAHSQPFITVEQFVKLRSAIPRPRDRIILKILFLCAVRRSELLVLKRKDFRKSGEMYTFAIQRSFDSRTHEIKEWNSALKAHGKVAVPPALASDIEGWRKYGDTNGADPESFLFPTRHGTCLIPPWNLSDPDELGGRCPEASRGKGRNPDCLLPLVPTGTRYRAASWRRRRQADPGPASTCQG